MVKPGGKMTLTAGQFAWYLDLNETPVLGTKPCLHFSELVILIKTQSPESLWPVFSSQCQWNSSRKQKHPKNIMQTNTLFLKIS